MSAYLDGHCDSTVKAESSVVGRSWSLFQVCGYTGLALAIVLAMTLVGHAGLSYWVMVGIVGTAVATFLGLVMATKIITSEERLIYYHQEIAVVLVAGLFLRAMRQPLPPYLDATILSIGLFLCCGRIGCLMVGCCHGRPHRWGVRYTEEHEAAGFPSYLVGVRLFPIQGVESLWVLGTVAAGTYFVWSGRPSGTALAWYVVTYNLGRFVFEFARGDADRPYWLGFSQPQWLSLVLTGGVVWAERAGRLPLSRWHLATFALLAATMIAVSLRRHFEETHRFELLHPRHIREVAHALELISVSETSLANASAHFAAIPVVCTSLGVQISGSEIRNKGAFARHYTFSCRQGLMTEAAARIFTRSILQLDPTVRSGELLEGRKGTFHLLTHPRQEIDGSSAQDMLVKFSVLENWR
jgi:Prolipoprotein diacylglyceryl transferase